jgi:hypothetical protein
MVPVVARPEVVPMVTRALPPTGPEIIVATSPVPVLTPARVPVVARAPAREGSRVGLSLGCDGQTTQS